MIEWHSMLTDKPPVNDIILLWLPTDDGIYRQKTVGYLTETGVILWQGFSGVYELNPGEYKKTWWAEITPPGSDPENEYVKPHHECGRKGNYISIKDPITVFCPVCGRRVKWE